MVPVTGGEVETRRAIGDDPPWNRPERQLARRVAGPGLEVIMTRRCASSKPRGLMALALVGALAAAMLAVTTPSRARPMCAEADRPVCASGANGRPTAVANACLAGAGVLRMASASACPDRATVPASDAGSVFGSRPDIRLAAANACPPEICKERYRPAPVSVDACGRPVIGGSRRVYSLGCGPAPAKRACPRVYAPVCGRVGRVERTYANDCEAERAGAGAIRRGECRVIAPPPPPRLVPPRICPQIYAPVCGRDRNGRLRTYPNDCMAPGGRAGVVHRGECRQAR